MKLVGEVHVEYMIESNERESSTILFQSSNVFGGDLDESLSFIENDDSHRGDRRSNCDDVGNVGTYERFRSVDLVVHVSLSVVGFIIRLVFHAKAKFESPCNIAETEKTCKFGMGLQAFSALDR